MFDVCSLWISGGLFNLQIIIVERTSAQKTIQKCDTCDPRSCPIVVSAKRYYRHVSIPVYKLHLSVNARFTGLVGSLDWIFQRDGHLKQICGIFRLLGACLHLLFGRWFLDRTIDLFIKQLKNESHSLKWQLNNIHDSVF